MSVPWRTSFWKPCAAVASRPSRKSSPAISRPGVSPAMACRETYNEAMPALYAGVNVELTYGPRLPAPEMQNLTHDLVLWTDSLNKSARQSFRTITLGLESACCLAAVLSEFSNHVLKTLVGLRQFNVKISSRQPGWTGVAKIAEKACGALVALAGDRISVDFFPTKRHMVDWRTPEERKEHRESWLKEPLATWRTELGSLEAVLERPFQRSWLRKARHLTASETTEMDAVLLETIQLRSGSSVPNVDLTDPTFIAPRAFWSPKTWSVTIHASIIEWNKDGSKKWTITHVHEESVTVIRPASSEVSSS